MSEAAELPTTTTSTTITPDAPSAPAQTEDAASQGTKRPLEDGTTGEPPAKRQKPESSEVLANLTTVDVSTEVDAPGLDFDADHSLRILVSPRSVGSIIGKGGATINAIKERTGTNISLVKEMPRYRPGFHIEPPQSVVCIDGPFKACNTAAQLILGLTSSMDSREFLTDEGEQRYVLEILIPEVMTGPVIGKAGSNIKDLTEKCGGRVRVVKLDDTLLYATKKDDGPVTIVKFDGTAQAVRTGHVYLYARIEEEAKKRGDDGFATTSSTRSYLPASTGPVVSAQFTLPPHLVGEVIGRGGEIIRRLSAESQAQIHISKEFAPGTNERAVEIVGTTEQIEKAKALIQAQLASSGGPPPSSLYPGYGAPAAPPGYYAPPPQPYYGAGGPPPHPSHIPTAPGQPLPDVTVAVASGTNELASMVFTVPVYAGGEIIGQRGVNIQALQAQSGARIHLEDPAPGANERVCKVTGTMAAVNTARDLIIERIQVAAANLAAGGMGGPPMGGPPMGGPHGGYAPPPQQQYGQPPAPQGYGGGYGGGAAPPAAGYVSGYGAPQQQQQQQQPQQQGPPQGQQPPQQQPGQGAPQAGGYAGGYAMPPRRAY